MVGHDVRLDELDMCVALLPLILQRLVVVVESSLLHVYRSVHLLLRRWLALEIFGWLNILLLHWLRLCLSCSILLLLHLLLYLIGGIGWILRLLRLCIFTPLFALACTVLRLIACHRELLRALRWIVRPLSISLLLIARLRYVCLWARGKIAFVRVIAALI